MRQALRVLAVTVVGGFWVSPVTAQLPAVGSGVLDVRVLRDGLPVAGARVCVGVPSDRNLYLQGVTDAMGRVALSPLPTTGFVVTAHVQEVLGAEQSFGPLATGVSFLPVALALVPTAALACPATAAGPNRSLIPADLQLPRQQTIPVLPATSGQPEFCFGAIGMGCGFAQGALPAGLCANGICRINAGSWAHDTCCHANPTGMACGGPETFLNVWGACSTAWNKAVRLTGKGLHWQRSVDFSRSNTTGTVEHSRYCAPRGTWITTGDGDKCCSRGSRAMTTTEQLASVAFNESLRVCE